MDDLAKSPITDATINRARSAVSELMACRLEVLDSNTGERVAAEISPMSYDFLALPIAGRSTWSRLPLDSLGMATASLISFSLVGDHGECQARLHPLTLR